MKDTLLLWAPRIAGAATVLFVAMFALDAFAGGDWRRQIPAFIAHLIPALTLLLVVLIAWYRPLFGAVAFFTLAGVYAITTRRADWILAISGPLSVAAILYLASWLRLRQHPQP